VNKVALDWADEGASSAWELDRECRHPSRTRAVVWLTLAFWLSNYVILTAGSYLAGRGSLPAIAAMRAVLVCFGLLLCYLIHLALVRLAPRSFRHRAIAAAILAPITAEIFAWASYFGFATLDPSRLDEPIRWSAAIIDVAFWTWFFLAWAGLYLALGYSMDAKAEELRSSELRAHAQAAKLQALHNQVSPHFLFNSLNSISGLIIDGRNKDAEHMVARLAGFFRQTLSVDPFEDIALSEEIALQRTYLEIEQLRFPDLVLDIDCPVPLLEAQVPPLILQPLVENAVKYGVTSSVPPARIGIRAWADGQLLSLTVCDGGAASADQTASGTGIGLHNVRERLRERFGMDARLIAGRGPDGFSITLELPLRLE
jgi:two-component system, LytTR family, sensor kinase